MKREDYFFCYNYRLHMFLEKVGIDYVTKAKHPTTDRLFTLYEQNRELTEAIEEYKANRGF